MYEGCNFFTSSPTLFTIAVFDCSPPTMVLIYISLMANEVEHLFMCSRAISNASDTSFPKSLLEKLYSFKYLQTVVLILKMFANYQVKWLSCPDYEWNGPFLFLKNFEIYSTWHKIHHVRVQFVVFSIFTVYAAITTV